MKWLRKISKYAPLLLMGVLCIWIFICEAAISFLANTTNNAVVNTGYLSAPAGCTQNQTVLLAFSVCQNTVTPVTWANPAGWTNIVANVTSNGLQMHVAWALYNSALTYHFAAGGTSSNWVGTVLGFNGVDPASPIDVTSNLTGATGTATNTAAITTTMPNDMLVFCMGTVLAARSWSAWKAGANTMAQVSNLTGSTSTGSLSVADYIQAGTGTTGTFNATINAAAGANGWGACAIALKPPTSSTGAGTIGALTASGTAMSTSLVNGTGSCSLDASGSFVTAAGTGTQVAVNVTGTGSCTINAITSSGTGAELFTATGSCTVNPMTCGGTGNLLFIATGACFMMALTAGGAGLVPMVGSGSGTIGAVTASGTGNYIPPAFSGTGSATVQPLTAGGAGLIPNMGSGAGTISPMKAAGTAWQGFTGSGAATFNSPTASGTGKELFTSTGAGTVGGVTISGTGAEVFTGIGSCLVGSLIASGTGKVPMIGQGVCIVSGLTAEGTGVEILSGSGAVFIGAMESSGNGMEAYTVPGSGAGTVGALAAYGQGATGFFGTGSCTVAQVILAAVGNEYFIGSGGAVTPSLNAAAAGGQYLLQLYPPGGPFNPNQPPINPVNPPIP